MAYAASLAVLARSAQIQGIPVFSELPGRNEHPILVRVFGESLAKEMAGTGYPNGLEVPLPAEDLYIYPLAELEQRQVGYRTNARTGEISSDWDAGRYVIADWIGNPVSIGRDGALAYSVHGKGSWGYRPIAPDLGTFLCVLSHWIDYYCGERSGNVLDVNFQVELTVADEVRQRVVNDLPTVEAKNFCDFLLGTI